MHLHVLVLGGEPDGVATFYRLIPGPCNTGGAYPSVLHPDTFCNLRSVFPGRYSAKIFTSGSVLVYFLHKFLHQYSQTLV